MRRKTTVSQHIPERVIPKLMSFILFIRSMRMKYKYAPSNIIAMDETAIWLDMTAETILEKRGAKSVPLKSTGHQKSRVTVVLAAKATGVKLKPMIVFKGKRWPKELTGVEGVIPKISDNGWMSDKLTSQFLEECIGLFAYGRRLLVWDSYRCHLSQNTKK